MQNEAGSRLLSGPPVTVNTMIGGQGRGGTRVAYVDLEGRDIPLHVLQARRMMSLQDPRNAATGPILQQHTAVGMTMGGNGPVPMGSSTANVLGLGAAPPQSTLQFMHQVASTDGSSQVPLVQPTSHPVTQYPASMPYGGHTGSGSTSPQGMYATGSPGMGNTSPQGGYRESPGMRGGQTMRNEFAPEMTYAQHAGIAPGPGPSLQQSSMALSTTGGAAPYTDYNTQAQMNAAQVLIDSISHYLPPGHTVASISPTGQRKMVAMRYRDPQTGRAIDPQTGDYVYDES